MPKGKKMFWNSKKTDLQCVERTLKLLAGFHAMSMNNPPFLKQYRSLIQMYFVLCKNADVVPSLITSEKEPPYV